MVTGPGPASSLLDLSGLRPSRLYASAHSAAVGGFAKTALPAGVLVVPPVYIGVLLPVDAVRTANA
jgi:hypothetical protein